MLTLGKVSRPEAESAGCKKNKSFFFESVQRAQTLLAELDKRKALLVKAKTCKMAFDLVFSSMGPILIVSPKKNR